MRTSVDPESRGSVAPETLEGIGRKSYGQLAEIERWTLAEARPGDLRIVLESALVEPPNIGLVVAVSAICARAVHCHDKDISRLAEPAGYFRVGRDADAFLSRQQR